MGSLATSKTKLQIYLVSLSILAASLICTWFCLEVRKPRSGTSANTNLWEGEIDVSSSIKILDRNVQVNAGSKLNIKKGGEIRIDGGVFSAVGSPDKPVVFSYSNNAGLSFSGKSDSVIRFINCEFRGCTSAGTFSNSIQFEGCRIVFDSCTFEGLCGQAPILSAKDSEVVFSNCRFDSIESSLLLFLDNCVTDIDNSTFEYAGEFPSWDPKGLHKPGYEPRLRRVVPYEYTNGEDISKKPKMLGICSGDINIRRCRFTGPELGLALGPNNYCNILNNEFSFTSLCIVIEGDARFAQSWNKWACSTLISQVDNGYKLYSDEDTDKWTKFARCCFNGNRLHGVAKTDGVKVYPPVLFIPTECVDFFFCMNSMWMCSEKVGSFVALNDLNEFSFNSLYIDVAHGTDNRPYIILENGGKAIRNLCVWNYGERGNEALFDIGQANKFMNPRNSEVEVADNVFVFLPLDQTILEINIDCNCSCNGIFLMPNNVWMCDRLKFGVFKTADNRFVACYDDDEPQTFVGSGECRVLNNDDNLTFEKVKLEGKWRKLYDFVMSEFVEKQRVLKPNEGVGYFRDPDTGELIEILGADY